MADLARPYRGVAHFGMWAEETADAYGRRDALAILATVVDQTADRSFRHDQATLEALDYLAGFTGGRSAAIRRFQTALSESDAPTRQAAVAAAYTALCGAVGAG